MKRFFIVVVLAVMVTATWCPFTEASSNPTVYLDGSKLNFDVPPQIVSGRTLVPMRAIFEALGASISWDNATKTVQGSKDSIKLKMTINSNTYYINNEAKTSDVAPIIQNGRTLVPLRIIAESLQCKVDYNGTSNIVTIQSSSGSQSTNIAKVDDFAIVDQNISYTENQNAPLGGHYSYNVTLTVKNTGNTTWQDDYSYELFGIGDCFSNEDKVLPGATYIIYERGTCDGPPPFYFTMQGPKGDFGEKVLLISGMK